MGCLGSGNLLGGSSLGGRAYFCCELFLLEPHEFLTAIIWEQSPHGTGRRKGGKNIVWHAWAFFILKVYFLVKALCQSTILKTYLRWRREFLLTLPLPAFLYYLWRKKENVVNKGQWIGNTKAREGARSWGKSYRHWGRGGSICKGHSPRHEPTKRLRLNQT